MRCCIFLLVTIAVGFCAVFGQEVDQTQGANNTETINTVVNDANENTNTEYDDAEHEFEKEFTNDDDDNVMGPNYHRPCEEGDNITIACVRDFFVNTGLCYGVNYDDGKVIHRARQVTYMPNNNLTVITTKSDIAFYGSKIIAFYINKRTNNLVMAVDFERIYIYSKFTYFLFERKAQEPLISGDYLTANYTTTLTAVTPIRRNLSIKATRVTAYNSNGNPYFEIGPKISNSSKSNFTYICYSNNDDPDSCIRNYFLSSGNCQESHHEEGVPVTGQSSNAYFSKIGLTALVKNANITFYNPQLLALYKNEDTNNLVFSMQFDGINMFSPEVTFRFHQPAREPFIAQDFVNGTYPLIMTAIMNLTAGLTREAVEGASITAVTFPPQFTIGRNVYLATLNNPIAFVSYAGLYLDVSTAVKEIFLTAAPHFFLLYLQEFYCDFGIPLSTHNWGNTIQL